MAYGLKTSSCDPLSVPLDKKMLQQVNENIKLLYMILYLIV